MVIADKWGQWFIITGSDYKSELEPMLLLSLMFSSTASYLKFCSGYFLVGLLKLFGFPFL
jgi:hypothetical protein